MKNDIKLSVVIISYKQAKYIKEAIDSVLMQKVNFKYELLLADDCSQDGTLEIMKEYEKKYPDIVRVLERKKNLGCAQNSMSACLCTKGKYITMLEGDDYWCDKNKLQIQVDFLEKNPEYIAVAHIQEGRDLKNNFKGYFPTTSKKNFEIDGVSDFINNEKFFSCTTTLYKNFYLDEEKLSVYKDLRTFDDLIGDAQINLFLSQLGKIYVMNKPMMVYRMRNNDGDSNFNSSHTIDEIEYRYMNIYVKMEEYFKFKYNFFKKIKNNYTLGVAYSILKFKFKSVKKFNKLCPKRHKWKIILLFPFTCFGILYKRFIKR